ncbi:hypothetical protein AWB78_08224 [Caballeronia calidae]|uniref:Tc1-like transposase DDE domain-containing protein n=1 Tax=Caballeronia calidae TaxID=1777139 RepID=A0A158EIN8_9BURK|nr:hypothetical protein AWB78_08224 [Caballeronia calidae]
MFNRKRAVHLIVDGLPAHKKAVVKDYVANTQGKLTLHFLPSYAPDLIQMNWCGVTSSAPVSCGAHFKKVKSWAQKFTSSCHKLAAIRALFDHFVGINLSAILLTCE